MGASVKNFILYNVGWFAAVFFAANGQPCAFMHLCDVRLPNGQPCEGNHRRINCPHK